MHAMTCRASLVSSTVCIWPSLLLRSAPIVGRMHGNSAGPGTPTRQGLIRISRLNSRRPGQPRKVDEVDMRSWCIIVWIRTTVCKPCCTASDYILRLNLACTARQCNCCLRRGNARSSSSQASMYIMPSSIAVGTFYQAPMHGHISKCSFVYYTRS